MHSHQSQFAFCNLFRNSAILTATFWAVLIGVQFANPHSCPAEEEGTRIVAGIRSADALIEDLEHVVAKIAGREASFENNIFPNIDIFLIGVDLTRPIRFDPIFSEEHGMEIQAIIPIEDLDDFLDENLDPIGIIPKRDRRDKDLYELTGNVFEGWLRVLRDPDYAVIFKRKEAIPKGMPHPAKLHEELVKQGYLLFAELDNEQTTPEFRKNAFTKLRETTIDALQKRPDETQNAFTLRKAALDQQLAVFQQWFVESSKFTVGGKLDKEENVAVSELLFSAVEGTQLHKDILRGRDEASYFTPVDEKEDALLTARINFMYNDDVAAGLRDVFKLSDAVAEEQIQENEKTSDSEKESQIKITKLINKILVASSELKVVDGFVDITPSGDHNAFLMGIRCNGQEEVNSIIEELPVGREGWKLEKDFAESEGVKIHKLSLADKSPKSLAKLYGPDHGDVYLAASDKAFWLAFGANAQSELTDRIKAVRTATDVKSDNIVLSLEAQLGPIATSMNDLINDESSLLGDLILQRQEKRAERKKKADEEEENEEPDRPARNAASAFLTLDWVEKIVGTMEGEDDTVRFAMKVDKEGNIVGDGEARRGILKALGVLIANFADENLQ